MKDLQKIGGAAALIIAVTWVVGFAVFLGVLMPAGYFAEGINAVEKARIIVDNQAIVSFSYLSAFVVFGVFLTILSLALYQRLKTGAPAMAQIATAFGLIWAGLVIASGMVANVGIAAVADLFRSDPIQAGTVWLAVETVQLGLGGGNEIVGGVWVLLIGWAALRAGEFPRVLNYLGVIIGGAGILTVIPFLEVLGAVELLGFVFGLGLLVWFVWLGMIMLRSSSIGRTPDASSVGEFQDSGT
jgi:hypothetical protein